ncbi:2OG-Fe(II) oxygenase [Kangiella koreensis]|uniref:2OG-Fe(II) oxygenase n=1 Tax=Kangiella koreensis (strain DSM 16069 / JCM 12317 / KCTC 12182 / SW-125) TaxID=523791 RepID=C7R6M7_KANKD|nr:2OG-Fe(II) oxygenase [Kangiella koreensis]ACV25543.1 2OG-Fe(II) oxygenase [Kangiella koreensis DSM 16069]
MSHALTSVSSSSTGYFDDDIFTRICDAITEQGYIVLPNALPLDVLNHLFSGLIDSNPHQFDQAGIGREQDFHTNEFVRTDQIQWLELHQIFAQDYFAWIEELRLRLNRHLFLGLFDYECMFAHYQEGAFYKRHLDAFRGGTNRRLTTVLYLNPQWNPEDGGELLIYRKRSKTPIETVVPSFGTLVVFLSEVFPHEVLPANKSRFSLTGWYRINEGLTL